MKFVTILYEIVKDFKEQPCFLVMLSSVSSRDVIKFVSVIGPVSHLFVADCAEVANLLSVTNLVNQVTMDNFVSLDAIGYGGLLFV